MTTPTARRITRPGATLRGEESGAGPTLLLLHAGGERRRVWTPVVNALATTGFRCVSYDQRGHGDSTHLPQPPDTATAHHADIAATGRAEPPEPEPGGASLGGLAGYAGDVAAMLRDEPLRCVVVGASLGGLAAIAALDDPAVRARVAGLVLVDVVPDPEPRRVRRFLEGIGMLGRHVELTDDILGRGPELRRIVAGLDMPILLVRGGSGSPVLDEDVERLLRVAPHATVTCVPEAGHLVARDRPVELAGALAATAEWPALALLRELGAERVEHPGGDLLDHLQRVRGLVADWGGSQRARLAALCHALYGTDGFPQALLSLDQRDRLRAAVGDEVEALVYRYGSCDRGETYVRLGATPLPFTDRFTGESVELAGADLADFALVSIANELDVLRTASLSAEARRGVEKLVAALAVYVPSFSERFNAVS